jgi:hypothetical protein
VLESAGKGRLLPLATPSIGRVCDDCWEFVDGVRRRPDGAEVPLSASWIAFKRFSAPVSAFRASLGGVDVGGVGGQSIAGSMLLPTEDDDQLRWTLLSPERGCDALGGIALIL